MKKYYDIGQLKNLIKNKYKIIEQKIIIDRSKVMTLLLFLYHFDDIRFIYNLNILHYIKYSQHRQVIFRCDPNLLMDQILLETVEISVRMR